MSDSSGFSQAAPRLSMVGRAVQQQRQVQRLNQQQIMSLQLLAMGSLDLREAIYSHAAENPALEIVHDELASGVGSAHESAAHATRFSDNTHYGAASAAGAAASDNFQAALESTEDSRESLQEHLAHQFNAIAHSADEAELGLALIHNLDAHGFHILAPQSLVNKSRPLQNEQLLERCMNEIRALDPIGTCCANVEESLFVQARLRQQAPRAALFLLDGHLQFLEPPIAEKVLKKITAFFSKQASLSFLSTKEQQWLTEASEKPFSIEEIERALAFIRTLDPYPARNFSSAQTHYIAPDVYVEKIPLNDEDVKNGIVSPIAGGDGAHSFKITFARGNVPAIAISKEFAALASAPQRGRRTQQQTTAAADKQAQAFATDAVRDAKAFIESIQFRESTVARAAYEIVRAQLAFFEHGTRYLAPLRQKDIADRIGVHEATVSRMAKGKYLQCEWGLFEFGYFFTNALATTTAAPSADGSSTPANSREAVKYEIAALLKAHGADKKPLSDQKLADLLAEKGIKVARRTVAKYRAELNINSSYER